jgi:hypothetical protein
MLCVPVYDRPGSVAAVLQLINTFDGRSFNQNDETLAVLVSEQIGNLLNVYKSRISRASMKPLHQITDAFRFRLATVVFQKAHNHLKCEASIFHGDMQFKQTKAIPIASSTVLSTESGPKSLFGSSSKATSLRQCEFDTWISFDDLGLSFRHLPLSTRVILYFSSKGNHPVGWTAFTLFDFEKILRTGLIMLPLYDGECLNPAGPILEGQTSNFSEQEANTVLIELPVFGSKVFYELNKQPSSDSSVSRAKLAGSGDSSSDTGSLDGLKEHMTTDMRQRFENGKCTVTAILYSYSLKSM